MNNDVGKKIENFVDTLPEVIRKEIAPGAIKRPIDKIMPTDDKVATIVKDIKANNP